MKKYVLFSLMLLAVAGVSAQITVTNATFPVVGDTLKLAIDNSPVGIVAATAPGGPQIWDFTGLQVDMTQNIVFRPASEGNLFANLPESDLFTNPSPGSEYYYNVTDTNFEFMANYGPDPYGIGFNALFNYNPPIVERRSPVNFFDIKGISAGLIEPFHHSVFPPAFIAALPVTVDSLRYRIAISRIDAVDAYGTLMIPGGTYEVLREKRTLYREARMDAKVPPLGWLDITDVVIQVAGISSLGVDTIVSFYFHNDVSKEHIAIVTVDTRFNEATHVLFKNTAGVTGTKELVAPKPSFIVSPNPANGDAVISFTNLMPGNYRLLITDASGRMIQQKTLQMSGSNQEKINLSRILPGMYILTLVDENNRVICQEKLMKGG